MKKSLVVSFIALLIAASNFNYAASKHSSKMLYTFSDSAKTKTVTLDVKGMTCGGCESKVRSTLKEKEGIISSEVSYSAGNATVTYNPDKINEDEIVNTINSTGFKCSAKGEKGKCNPGCEKACCKKGNKDGCKPGCEKACCKKGHKDGCKPGCEKACCKGKKEKKEDKSNM